MDHAKIGALLCRKWKLPKLLGEAILSHHFYENKKTPSGGIKTILQVLNLSSLLVGAMIDNNVDEQRPELVARAKEFFGFGPDDVDDLLGRILEPAKQVGEAFSIETGTRRLLSKRRNSRPKTRLNAVGTIIRIRRRLNFAETAGRHWQSRWRRPSTRTRSSLPRTQLQVDARCVS